MRRHIPHIGLSVSAFIFLMLHLHVPGMQLDQIGIALVAIGVLPWLGSVFKTIEFPGGGKVEYRDLASAEAKAQKAGLLASPADATSSSSAAGETAKNNRETPAFMEIATRDPNLALAGLRIELERQLKRIAQRHGVAIDGRRTSLRTLARDLGGAGILTPEQVSVLSDLGATLNQAVHGAEVHADAAEWAVSTGESLLAGIRRLE